MRELVVHGVYRHFKRFIVVQCAFGAFHLPDIAGAYEAIDAAKPGICA